MGFNTVLIFLLIIAVFIGSQAAIFFALRVLLRTRARFGVRRRVAMLLVTAVLAADLAQAEMLVSVCSKLWR